MKTIERKSAKSSPFFNIRVLLGLAGISLARTSFGLDPGGPAVAKPSQQPGQQWQPHWVVVQSSHNDTSAPLREMATWPVRPAEAEREGPENPKIGIIRPTENQPDSVVQDFFAGLAASPSVPGIDFDGIPYPGVGCNCLPPDPNGYVGLTQYVQIVNRAYEVFDKFTGSSTLGPAAIETVWAGFGGMCEAGGNGDPVVLYDKLAQRWLISQFAQVGAAPDHECIAVSTTTDATGSYYRYDFDLTGFGANYYDYPKIGAWPDAYYMSDNVFDVSGTTYLGPEPFAFDRNKMLCGLPATVISPGIVSSGGPPDKEDPFLPADFDGTILPPSGAPNTYLEFPDDAGNNLRHYLIWHFSVGSPFGTGMSFTTFVAPAAASYTALCPGTRGCVPQASTFEKLDGIGDRLMFRSAYRNYGTPTAPDESLVCNFSVGGQTSGIRWFEAKNVTNGPVTLKQESTYNPGVTDGFWRWLGSIAMDHSGDLAVGFSRSSDAINPQIRYATRLSTNPLNKLYSEADLFDGTGSQLSTGDRWGDYSAMTVDPVDDTTMWYTNEYYANTSDHDYRTRIGSFRINSNQALVNVSAKSRLPHGAAGAYSLDLPLYAVLPGSGRAVESRSNGGSYTIVFNFSNSVTGVGGVTTSCGSATAAIGSPDNHQVLASLSAGTCNGQYITVRLTNVTDGTHTIGPSVRFGLLLGDTSGNGIVNSADVALTRAQSGLAACPPNFRMDVNATGIIDRADVGVVRANLGNTLPTPP